MQDYTKTPGMTAQPSRKSHDIEHIIHGHDIQFVEVILDPGETVIAENGLMMYMENGIQMDTRFSDGSEKNGGMFGTLFGMAKRKLIGESIFLAFFTNKGTSKKKVAFAAPHPGMIIPLDLRELGGSLLCQKGAFMCASRGTEINVGFTKRLTAGFFGGEGFILQRLNGDGQAFIHSGGTIMERTLGDGETLYVDTGSVVAFTPSVTFDIKIITGMKNIMFGHESLFLTTLVGPGKVWLQSLPFSRVSEAIIQSFVDYQGKNRG